MISKRKPKQLIKNTLKVHKVLKNNKTLLLYETV